MIDLLKYFERTNIMGRKKEKNLTELELSIMNILWDHNTDLTANEIFDFLQQQNMDISIASVSQIIKRLLEKKLIEVKSLKPSARVYARTFSPLISKSDYLASELTRLQNLISSNAFLGRLGLFQMLLGHKGNQQMDAESLKKIEKIFHDSKAALDEE